MWSLIRNEIKKMISKKRFIVVLSMTFGLVALATFGAYKNIGYELPKKRAERLKESINYYEEKKKYALENNQIMQAERYGIWVEEDKNELAIKEELLDNSIPCKERLKKEIEFLNKRKGEGATPSLDTEIQKLNDEISEKQYYLDNDLEYDYNGDGTAFIALPSLLKTIDRLFIIVIIGILASDIISGENDPATIKVLLTKPVSRGKVLISKFLAVVFMSNVIVLILEFIAFIFLGLILGFGDPSAPIAVGTKYKMDMALVGNTGQSISAVIGSSYLVTTWEFTIKALILQTFLITATVSFCFLMSTLIKNSSVSTGVSFISMLILLCITVKITLLSEQGLPNILNRVLPFIFTSYFDITSVIKGNWAGLLICPLITYKFSLFILTAWIIVCYLISYFNFVKKDII